MANELGIKSKHYIDIEVGNIDLKLSVLFELSQILDVQFSKLFSISDICDKYYGKELLLQNQQLLNNKS